MYRGTQRIGDITYPFNLPHLPTDPRFLPATYFHHPSESEFITSVLTELGQQGKQQQQQEQQEQEQEQQQQQQQQSSELEVNESSTPSTPPSPNAKTTSTKILRANVLAGIFAQGAVRDVDGQDSSVIPQSQQRLAWIDCEMSGLSPDEHTILQISCVITELNEDLDLVAEHEPLVIHHPAEIISNFSPWCVKNHAKSGLTDMVRQSNVQMKEAEDYLVNFLQKFTRKGVSLAGNSVYVDKMFLEKHMPRVNDHLHYRLVDVSSVAKLSQALNSVVYRLSPPKEKTHTTRTDIYESIQQLRYLNKHFFKLLRK